MAIDDFVPTHILRVDAVNFDSFLFDTDDLSTIRGGSLLLLDSGSFLEERLGRFFGEESDGSNQNSRHWRTILTAASMAIFELSLATDGDASRLRESVEKSLLEEKRLRHATFVTDVLAVGSPGETGTSGVLTALVALNRRRKLSALSLAVPRWNTGDFGAPCALDGLRPSRIGSPARGRNPESPRDTEDVEEVSASVGLRQRYGREQKSRFYQRITGLDLKFCGMLEEIAGDPPPEARHLENKIAVIYLDGNRFGDRIRAVTDSPARYRTVSERISSQRRELLRDLLTRMSDDKEGWVNRKGAAERYRLETLLWGGDEIIWVVPAWKGWEALRFFFETARGWKLEEGHGAGLTGTEALTHSAGLVFASYKAPIQRLTDLARALADKVKEVTNRNANAFACEVLESYDHTGGGGLDAYYARRYPCWAKDPKGGSADEREGEGQNWLNFGMLTLFGEKMAGIQSAMRRLERSGGFPARRLHINVGKVLNSLTIESALKATAADSAVLEDLPSLLSPPVSSGRNPAAWLHAALLWDYVARVPEPLPAGPGSSSHSIPSPSPSPRP